MNFHIDKKIELFEYILKYYINFQFIIEKNIDDELIIDDDFNFFKR